MITLDGVSDETTRGVIEKVLARLPEKVRQFVTKWCLFASLRPGVKAMCLPIHVLESEVGHPIVLDFAQMQSE